MDGNRMATGELTDEEVFGGPQIPGMRTDVPTTYIIGGANRPSKAAQTELSDEEVFGSGQKVSQGLPDNSNIDQKQVSPVSASQSFLQSLWKDPTTGIGQIYAHLTQSPEIAKGVDQQVSEQESDYQAGKKAAGREGFDWARLGGNVVGGLMLPMAKAATLPGVMMSGALTGTILGGTQPVTQGDFGEEKAKQTGLGAITGGIAPAVTRGIANVVKPQLSAAAELLNSSGITTTIGQTLGGSAKRIEDAATSIPFIGDLIKNSQRGTVEQFNRAAIDRSLTPIGEKLPSNIPVGRDAIEYASNKLTDAYDSLLPKLSVKVDKQFVQDLSSLKSAAQNLPQAQLDQFNRIMANEVTNRFTPLGTMSGETMKNVESKLGEMAKNYSRSADYDVRNMGAAIRQAQASLRSMVERSNPGYQGQLKAINEGYANFIRVQNASGRLGADSGIFSPAQLLSAVKNGDPSRNKAQFAKGNALMQDLAEAGKSVLGNKVPDSGTPLRSAVGAAALGLGGHFVSPIAPLLGGVASLPYAPGGRQLVNALLTKRPQGAKELANALRLAAPYTSPALTPLLYPGVKE